MKTLLLIDANSFIHRAYHALPPLKSPKGEPTGALLGLTNTLMKLLEDKKPDYVAAAFDRPEPTFRKEKFEEYKAHRPKAPDELISQIIESRNLMKALNIKSFEVPRYEADDIIGTLVEKHKNEENLKILILTGDLDTLQLIEKNVEVEVPGKGISDLRIYDEKATEARFGVPPERLTDYKGLVGDASDNIPGVPGVGPKTAGELLKEFGTIENIYKEMPESHKLAKKILPNKESAFLSKDLATIKRDAPIHAALEDIEYEEADKQQLVEYLQTLGFQNIIKRLGYAPILSDSPAGEEKTKSSAPTKEGPHGTNQSIIIFQDAAACKTHAKLLLGNKLKVAWGWKDLLKETGITNIMPPLFDVRIAGWLLNPEKKDTSLETLAKTFLEKETSAPTQALIGDLFVAEERALKKEGLEKVFEEIEMPLIPVLAEMELWGIKVNEEKLEELLEEAKKELASLEKKIYKEVGEEFNVNSPKQLGEILFDKLKIGSGGKRTGTGQRSTREEVLEELKNAHPVIPSLLEYRETFKIRTTYLEPLLEIAKASKGKIHTTYLQTGTATGRLSSEKPNLQNIPQESKWAIPLRKTFEAEGGKSLLALDYSQLELRLLAHTVGDEELKKAFEEGRDIHTLTASKIFKIPLEKVDKEKRRVGKTLNFGIIYGMGPRAFAQTGNIPLSEAKEIIDTYWQNFPDIKKWHEKTIAHAHKEGFVENEHGRKRWFEHAGTSHPRYQAEIARAAINMPIQSLGADIIKRAMIESAELLEKKGWKGKKARLLLSIHDELIFEVDDDILKEAEQILGHCMENVYKLTVPIRVEARSGKNWGSMSSSI
ncbi:MAG: DNA polymerase [bacterium]|nr:DNA polymerase [bacterium]